jgi:hypothetical protein
MLKIAHRTPNAGRRGALPHAAAALLAFAAFSAPASATPLQQYLKGECTGFTCAATFAAVPAGQRLEIDSVSCYVRIKGTAAVEGQIRALQLLVLGSNLSAFHAVTLVPKFVGGLTVAGAREGVYSANHSIFAFASGAQRFQAYVDLGLGVLSQFACHISGDLVKA